jgi:hypothetical protein
MITASPQILIIDVPWKKKREIMNANMMERIRRMKKVLKGLIILIGLK